MSEEEILKKISHYTLLRPKDNVIGIDSLALMLRMSEALLLAILTRLEDEGKIEINKCPNNSRRRTRSGTVRCLDK